MNIKNRVPLKDQEKPAQACQKCWKVCWKFGKKRKSKCRILNLSSIVLQHLMTSVMLPEDLGSRQAAVTIHAQNPFSYVQSSEKVKGGSHQSKALLFKSPLFNAAHTLWNSVADLYFLEHL